MTETTYTLPEPNRIKTHGYSTTLAYTKTQQLEAFAAGRASRDGEVEALRDAQQWVPVSERLPKHGEEVMILARPDFKHRKPFVTLGAYWEAGTDAFTSICQPGKQAGTTTIVKAGCSIICQSTPVHGTGTPRMKSTSASWRLQTPRPAAAPNAVEVVAHLLRVHEDRTDGEARKLAEAMLSANPDAATMVPMAAAPAIPDVPQPKGLTEGTAAAHLSDLCAALDGAFISSWQSTHAWQKELDAAKGYIEAKLKGGA